MLLQVIDGVGSVMKDRCCQRSIGLARLEDLDEVVWLARSAGCNDWDVYGPGDRLREVAVKAGLNPIGVHGCEENFSCPERFTLLSPLDGVDAFINPSA